MKAHLVLPLFYLQDNRGKKNKYVFFFLFILVCKLSTCLKSSEWFTLDKESELGWEGNDQDKEKRKGQVLKWMVEEEIVTSNTHFQRKRKEMDFSLWNRVGCEEKLIEKGGRRLKWKRLNREIDEIRCMILDWDVKKGHWLNDPIPYKYYV